MNKPSHKESVQDVVTRLRANRSHRQSKKEGEAAHSSNDQPQCNSPTRTKASKNTLAVSAAERKTEAKRIIKRLLFGELTQGQALKSLRVNIG